MNIFKGLVSLGLVGIVGACSPTPLSPDESFSAAAKQHVYNACVQHGWFQNTAVTSYYGAFLSRLISNRGDAAMMAAARTEAAKYPVRIEHCRMMEDAAHQHYQNEQRQTQQSAQLSQAFDSVGQAGQQAQAQALARRPTYTNCQYLPWGNMTSCTSY